MKIVQAPSPVLSEKAKPIKKIDQAILDLIEDMKKVLLSASDPEGVGLAAPQVGFALQLFIAKPETASPITVYINPRLTIVEENTVTVQKKGKKKKEEIQLEGCLSLKDIWGTVVRAKKVEITYMDEHGKIHIKTASGFLSTVLQHEYDHLQGILFPRRVLEQKGQLYKSHKNEDGEDEFEEMAI